VTFAVHNAVQLDDAEVRDRFVVRNWELGELLAHLREPDPPRHALVIGQRGMGKSLLLRRVAVTVADEPDLAARWLPVVMPEELYEVTSTGELWLAALGHLATTEADADLTAQHAALLAEPDPVRLATLALERLLTAARNRGRKVLLLAENLDMLLDDQVAADDGWTLRAALQSEPHLLLIGSSVTSFSRLESSGEAFYGFFHRIDLGPLGDDDVRALWHKVTGVELAGDRIVPIRILTGGNPRLVSVLGRFSERGDLSSLRQDLELLIDEYTPYFKANIEVLPATERKVFVTLADIWAPATAAEVAQKARMTSSQVSALLGRLVRRGAVQAVDAGGSRQHYELTERLYNLYHLLRRSGGEGRLRALVDILVHLYGSGELERDVLPRLAGLPPSPLDTSIASGVHRHLDEVVDVWSDMPPHELAARKATFEALLESQRATLGDDHPDTLLTRQTLAYVDGICGEPATALRLYQGVLADQQRIVGPDNPDTLVTRQGIAYFVAELGDARRALELSEAIAGDRERVLGATHRDTLISRHEVAYYLDQLGDTQTALDIEADVLRRAEATLPFDHALVLDARWLHGRLTVQLAAAGDRPQPREVRAALDGATRAGRSPG
jgi:hypothetical protein